MQPICQLLLLLKDLLFIGKSIPQSDVLEPVLVNFLILQLIHFFPLLKHLLRNLLSSSAEHSIGSHTPLQLLELALYFMALSLLLIQFSLKLTSHFVVPVLGFFQVKSHLMNIGQGV